MSERIEIPYGLQVAADCLALEENKHEQAVLYRVLAGLVDDRSLGKIAGDLNEEGLETRQSGAWTASDVFELLPRVVEVGPAIFRSREWGSRQRGELRAV